MSISIPNTIFPNIAPKRPEVAVVARAMALKTVNIASAYSFTVKIYLRCVGNRSTTTQNNTASRTLVRASKTQDKIKVCVVLETQFSPKAERPDNTRPQTEINKGGNY